MRATVYRLLCLLLASSVLNLTTAFEQPSVYDEDYEDANQLMKIISKPRTPMALKHGFSQTSKTLASFSWKDCGDPSNVAHVSSITMSPDPLRLPGNVTVGFTWQTNEDLTAPISMDLKLEKKIVVWIPVPCHLIPGGCHHDNVCNELSQETCPPDFQTCHCPFQKGVYKMAPTSFAIPQGGVPSGDYRVTAWLKEGSKQVGCVFLQFAVSG